MSRVDHHNAFLRLFRQTARYHSRSKVFEDFIHCAAIAIHNSVRFSQKLEARYLDIIAGYEKEDAVHLAQLLSHVVLGLDDHQGDFLGQVFMGLELGDKYRGQFFTPFSIATCMAKLQFADVPARLEKQPFITVYEPACGAGCMLLAVASEMREMGYSPSQHLWVSAVDIDPLAANMAYIQLSLCDIPGEVVIGNALAEERRWRWLTPAHYLGNWGHRLRRCQEGDNNVV